MNSTTPSPWRLAIRRDPTRTWPVHARHTTTGVEQRAPFANFTNALHAAHLLTIGKMPWLWLPHTEEVEATP